MEYSAKYLENSLYYLPWKTKFIEKFCMQFAFLKRKMRECNFSDFEDRRKIVELYSLLFDTALYILKKKLKSDGNNNIHFYTDVIYESQKNGLISNGDVFFEILNFYEKYKLKEKGVEDFKNIYVSVLEDFNRKFKILARFSGNRSREYVFF